MAVENEEILMRMGELCKELDAKDEEINRKGRLVSGFVGEVEDVMMSGEQTHLELIELKDEYHILVNSGMAGRNHLISKN